MPHGAQCCNASGLEGHCCWRRISYLSRRRRALSRRHCSAPSAVLEAGAARLRNCLPRQRSGLAACQRPFDGTKQPRALRHGALHTSLHSADLCISRALCGALHANISLARLAGGVANTPRGATRLRTAAERRRAAFRARRLRSGPNAKGTDAWGVIAASTSAGRPAGERGEGRQRAACALSKVCDVCAQKRAPKNHSSASAPSRLGAGGCARAPRRFRLAARRAPGP